MIFRPTLGLILFTLTCLQAFGLYLFLKGFLLTRQTFELQGRTYASWDRFPLHMANQASVLPPTVPSKQAFKRTIVILIDALRFDFVLNTTNPSNPYYLNQFPILEQLRHTQPQSTLLFQFRADPPTTTMQRVKGIMTGSLPTFIDAGANFASSAVGEDHLLKHIKDKYNKLYFMGDDTWVSLFPETFNDPQRTFDSDSFKMLDLDSVDNAILSHLWPLMEENGKDEDWQVAIAHFLGVDHCGHAFGPSVPIMAKKLNQMNTIIERLLAQVDKDTLLVVMGDHGMTMEGDHGGESAEELISTLFMYSGRQLKLENTYYETLYKRIHEARSKRLDYDMDSISQRLSYNASQYPIVAQIHLVPTLAYLLQVPIPFGNLGAIIPDVIYPDNDKNQIANLVHMIEQFRKNALQVYDYLIQYDQQTHQLDFSPKKLEPIMQHLYKAEKIMFELTQHTPFFDAVKSESSSEKEYAMYGLHLEEIIMEYDAFLTSTIKYCEAIWAQFDTGCMFIGILLLGCSTLTSFRLMKRDPRLSYNKMALIGCTVFTSCLVLTWMRASLAHHLLVKGWFEKMEKVDWIGASIAIAVCSIFSFMNGETGFFQNHVFWYTSDWFLILIADIAQSATLGSNSFVIWEDRGTRFIAATLTVCWLVRNLQSISHFTKTSTTKAVVYPATFLFLIRVTSLTGHCREEQFPHCNYVNSGVLEFEWSLLGVFSVLLVSAFCIMILYYSKTYLNNSSVWIVCMYQASGFLTMLKIIQEVYQKNFLSQRTEIYIILQKVMDVYLPRLVYIMCLIGSVLSIGQWCMSKKKKQGIILGWDLLLLWSTVLAIVQRPLASLVVLASPTFIYLLTRGASSSLLIRLTLLHFLGHHLFFVTGHQATFTSLPWKAAFVGFDEMSYYGGMILVTLSTTAGYIISWMGWFIVLIDESKHGNNIRQPLHLMTLLQSIPTFLSAIFILILRRHLMTWKIFAPRFLVQILLAIGSHLAAIVIEKALL